MRYFNLMIYTICMFQQIHHTTGQVDEQCLVGCACCIDKICGRGLLYPDECILGCIDRHIGHRCYIKCTHNCTKCPYDRDACTACYDGYYPGFARDCTSKCLPGCKTCTTGTTCTSCKEGYYNADGQTDCNCPVNCNCNNGLCVSCKDGYYDTSNLCYSLCPGNCITCSSNKDCGSCKDGYYKGYHNDNTYLPLLNDCTYKCRDNCIQCSSYDSCSACKTGFYGPNCDNRCSSGCISNTCDIRTGNCDCSTNNAEVRCDKCKTGKYANMCDQECPAMCKGSVCDKDSGECTDGCTTNTIIGDKCDVCLTGWYGQYCKRFCSVGCKSWQCERNNGKCSNGCIDNFVGVQCNQCISGKYGYNCNSYCPANCDWRGCLKDSGNCNVCNENFAGGQCEKCSVGFYGSRCSEICPSNCWNSLCDRDTGTCSDGCVDNYSGDRCCINNNNCITCLSDTGCVQCKSGYFNDQCDKQCPKNCLKSCHIETGFCDDCKGNFYGNNCNFSCASTCSVQTTTEGNICHQTDGKCLYGCVDGFHGLQCSEICSAYCNDTICDQSTGKCTKGCKVRVNNDLICPLASENKILDSISSGQPVNTAVAILGTGFAVSVVVNIILVVTLNFWKCRKRANENSKTKGPLYENSGIELECGYSENAGNVSNHRLVQATNRDSVLKSHDYEDLGRAQVSEHEYGQISTRHWVSLMYGI